MRLYIEVWADQVGSPEDFWDVAADVADTLNEIEGDGWKITEIGIDSHRVLYKNGREQPLLTKMAS